ncbi:MAG: AAA family ATPase [Verrucomicrobia bacterium]|nr:AAA family ATPase [Verrucomicrobiota bacterium]MCG2679642.1 AAA family ATPase [Kiritimatiellia bacterium]
MITKCKRLKNVGKFYDFSAQANALDWHKNTFVFAPNAYGKSTLVNVLRSLRENDPKLIRARKTLGALAAPEAVIVIDEANHYFNGTRWDRPFPSIQIFDVPFIHANILAHEIGHEHKKNIHRIIIGAQGIKLAEELAALKTKEKSKSQEVANFASQFNRGGFTFSMDAFLAIPPAEEAAVGARIQKLEQDIKSKESEAVVQRLGLPRQIAAPSFDLSTAKALAAKKLAAAHEAAEKQVLAHIERNFMDKTQARPFIRQGLDLVQADCPFCGQDLKKAADLLKAYREFFDEAFRAYQQGVAQQVAALAKWNLDNDLTALGSTHNANLATLRQWEPYLGPIILPDAAATVEKCRAVLAELKGKVQSEMEKKQKDPNADADRSQFNALTTELGELKTAVEAYNTVVTAFTEKAKRYVANLPKSDVASIRAALAKEQQIKTRFAPEWKKWATDYPPAKKDADDFLNQKNVKQKELEDYSKTIFDTYQKRINEILFGLRADYKITGLVSRVDNKANEAYSDFSFLILDREVPLSVRQDDAPCFKNTLSEGDKSTLAFAFFVASLEREPDLDKQIVIFDDPLSSLDENRRLGTVGWLADLSPRLNQFCVFTHKKDFLRMLFDHIREKVVLQIKSDKTNGSRIEPFDVEEDRKAEIARLFDDMGRYINEDYGPTPEDMQGKIRKVFEIILKTKYYPALTTEIKCKKGLGDLIGTLHGKKLIGDATKDQLFHLGRLSDTAHHGGLAKLPEHTLTREEVCSAIQETFGVAEKV